ncbi:DUF2946 domain-containing protein [Burkholderiaceae bacterium DAT-1]|nr:DUF2946 domain-containing protein [Burkholderiaceae bacterium DAT-1]
MHRFPAHLARWLALIALLSASVMPALARTSGTQYLRMSMCTSPVVGGKTAVTQSLSGKNELISSSGSSGLDHGDVCPWCMLHAQSDALLPPSNVWIPDDVLRHLDPAERAAPAVRSLSRFLQPPGRAPPL